MVARKLNIIKVQRYDEIPDIPIDFEPLYNLHLEKIEIKKKLKNNLPALEKIIEKARPRSADVTSELSLSDRESIAQRSVSVASQPHSFASTSASAGSDGSDREMLAQFEIEKPSPRIEFDFEGEGTEKGDTKGTEKETDKETDDSNVEEDEFAHLTPEQRQEMERQEYLWRFRILKKKYKNIKVPDFSDYSDVKLMKVSYDRTLKEVMLDENVETFRMYLVATWIVLEFVATKYLRINLSGFTNAQQKSMHKYESLLIELGEKRRRSTWGSNWPVEARLIAVVVFQAAFFYLTKIISDQVGDSVSSLFSSLMGQPAPHSSPPGEFAPAPNRTSPEAGRKMKGPSITAQKIRELRKEHN